MSDVGAQESGDGTGDVDGTGDAREEMAGVEGDDESTGGAHHWSQRSHGQDHPSL